MAEWDNYNIVLLFQFDELVSKVSGSSISSSTQSEKPQFIFELEYNDEQEIKFQNTIGSHGVMLAYHGSSVENFHSIIHNGLLNLFNKVFPVNRLNNKLIFLSPYQTSAFGEGTYLSTELSVCLNWSPNGALWPHSLLPHTVSCVAVCEVVSHPSVM